MEKLDFIYNDGGRKEAGFKGHTRDCVTRAIAIVTGIPYREVYNNLNELNKEMGYWNSHKLKKTVYGNTYVKKSSARTGVQRKVFDKYLKSLGYEWVPTMKIGIGCKIHLRKNELPKGKLIIRVSKHLTAMIDSVINDTFDCSRNGTRCVYGFYVKKENKM